MIRTATQEDAPAVTQIYNHYIEHTVVTFEEELVPVSEMASRIAAGEGAGLPWSVCQQEEQVVGYGYLGKWHKRSAFRFAAELTVYLHPDAVGCGAGTLMYERLFEQARECGFRTLLAAISLPNEASIKLQEKFGLKKVAHHEKIGFKFGRWVDTGVWQIHFDAPDGG